MLQRTRGLWFPCYRAFELALILSLESMWLMGIPAQGWLLSNLYVCICHSTHGGQRTTYKSLILSFYHMYDSLDLNSGRQAWRPATPPTEPSHWSPVQDSFLFVAELSRSIVNFSYGDNTVTHNKYNSKVYKRKQRPPKDPHVTPHPVP